MGTKAVKAGSSISNCVFTNTTAPANKHTRDAVVALAKALQANAVALGDAARALKGGDARMDRAIRIDGA